MASRLGICPNIFRVLFCIVNLMILVLGLLGFALSIYLIVVNNNYAFITGSSIVSGAALLMIAAIATVVIAGLGFVGAAFKWRPILIIYVSVLLVIVLIEIIGAIVIYVFRGNLAPLASDQLSDAIEEQIILYRRNQDDPGYQPSVNTVVDFIQNTFRCCGAGNGPLDWSYNNSAYLRDNNKMLPPSCSCDMGRENCRVVSLNITINGTSFGMVNQTAWDNSCVEGTREAVFALALFGGGLCIALGILELLGVLVGVGLCICITTADKDQQVV